MRAPKFTRLRWVSSKDPNKLVKFLERLTFRVQIYQIVFDGSVHVMYFVPDDDVPFDGIKSGKLK
jgi:hypothetical protein